MIDMKMFEQMKPAMDEKQFKAIVDASVKQADETVSIAKDNIDAMVQANSALVKNVEGLTKSLVTFQKQALDAALENFKALSGIKDVTEAVEIQSKFARERFDASVEEANKISEMTTKAADEAAKPIKARVEVAMQKAQALQKEATSKVNGAAKAA